MPFRSALCSVVVVLSTGAAYCGDGDLAILPARVLAVGLPGAGAVSQVGAFHEGGPIHDKPNFKPFTAPGQVLDPDRVLVATSSNFGATLGQEGRAAGSILSLDTAGPVLVIPPDFAAGGHQEATLDGRVRLYTAQSAAFRNGLNTPGAATADYPPVSNPLGISINNAFGRLWFANAPTGSDGIGTLSIVDPGGQPLANAPSHLAGGVLAGDLTGRPGGQVVSGSLARGALATALLGMSPDGSRRAVFAVLTADGALAQAHTEQALDGLAPAGTVSPVDHLAGPDTTGPGVTRVGMAFNWVPDRVLYVTDPVRNAVVTITLADDGHVFHPANVALFRSPLFAQPVDIAPAMPESANPVFSSNSTLAGGADLYVANRGDGTLLRLRQDGTVVAQRAVRVPGDAGPLGPGRLNGIAVSRDGERIWLTVSGPLPGFDAVRGGSLVEVPAFGPGRSASIDPATETAQVEKGAALFAHGFEASEGLGPSFNEASCTACHGHPMVGGVGLHGGLATVYRVGRSALSGFDPLIGRGGPVARFRRIEPAIETGCTAAYGGIGIPAAATAVSVRNAPALFGLGLVDTIADETIIAGSLHPGGGPRGHPGFVRNVEGRLRVGRFGWKADTADLSQMVAVAFRNELGLTSPLEPVDEITCVAGSMPTPDLDEATVAAVARYVAALPAPQPRGMTPVAASGEAVFARIGCVACHTPSLPTTAGEPVHLYSDLLLHDMGPSLDDGVPQGSAAGADWRTTPLWGVSARPRLLHDGRASTLQAAILEHDGEADLAMQAYRALAEDDRAALLAFLGQL